MAFSPTSALESLESRVLFASGDIDVAFNNGQLLTGGPNPVWIQDLEVLGDGGIVVAGTSPLKTGDTTLNRAYLAKYLFDGTLDTSFGASGRILATPRGLQNPERVGVMSDGSVVVLGSLIAGDVTSPLMVKFSARGTLDTDFGVNGALDFSDLNEIESFIIDPRDRIVVVSSKDNSDVIDRQHGVLRRYTPTGEIDTSFHGGEDVVVATYGPVSAGQYRRMSLQSLAVDSLGRLIVTTDNQRFSAADQLLETSSAVYRLTPSGKVDRPFGASGHTDLPAGSDPEIAGITASGQILVSASDRIVRLDENGLIDSKYGSGGSIAVPAIESASPRSKRSAISPDGAIMRIFSGNNTADSQHFAVQRFDRNGKPDKAFGQSGVVSLTTSKEASVNAMAVAPDGTLVMAGQTGEGATLNFALARVYSNDGPAMQLIPRTLRTSSRYLSMTVLIRDDDGIDLSKMDNGDLKLFDADGNTRKIRFLNREDVRGDGTYLRATYRIIGPGSTNWSKASNGFYEVRLQRQQLADTEGNFAAAQVLGRLRVRILK